MNHVIIMGDYLNHTIARSNKNLPPLPLSEKQTNSVCRLLENGKMEFGNIDLMSLLVTEVSPGLSDSAKIKADFLLEVALGYVEIKGFKKSIAVNLLGTMKGGHCVPPLLDLLRDVDTAQAAYYALSRIILITKTEFAEVVKMSKLGNSFASKLLVKWSNAEWFEERPPMPEEIKLRVFKVDGKTNTDDLSPATEAHTRADIPLHAQSMLSSKGDDVLPSLLAMRKGDLPLAFVGDDLWAGSSRKSAGNSFQWNCGDDIPFVPAKRTGGVVIANNLAPIGFDTLRDSGGIPIRADVSKFKTGDVIVVKPYEGVIEDEEGNILSTFDMPKTLPDEYRAGGRLNLIMGKELTNLARSFHSIEPSDTFIESDVPLDTGKGYTLAQKLIGKACGLPGVRAGQYVEPSVSTVASQDTTGKMTRDELIELCCAEFSSETLFMQSFCHTAAVPKPTDLELHASLPKFVELRKGVALKPGDGVVHTWINRMLVPDELGTGGDSHTRFPLGISFPAGSGLVAFAAMNGKMPIDVPESVLVKFSGSLQPGITLRDAVNAIPYFALKEGLLELGDGAPNVFNGKILEIQGLPDLEVEQAFELTDASAERSAAACAIELHSDSVIRYVESNIVLLHDLIDKGYGCKETLLKRIAKMEEWLENPELLKADDDAEYHTVIEINLDDLAEPVLACPNDPDDVKLLSQVAGTKIDEVFTGSCMTNVGHFRATSTILETASNDLPVKFWAAPPSRMDRAVLDKEGLSDVLNVSGHLEVSGCSLCMGNQKRVANDAVVMSTSTRNFPKRLGNGAQVYLGSAELAGVTAKLGRIPTLQEYMEEVKIIESKASEIYRYHDFTVNGVPV